MPTISGVLGLFGAAVSICVTGLAGQMNICISLLIAKIFLFGPVPPAPQYDPTAKLNFRYEPVLLDEREDEHVPAELVGKLAGLGKAAVGAVEVVQPNAELLEVVGALHAIGGLAHLLHRRQAAGRSGCR